MEDQVQLADTNKDCEGAIIMNTSREKTLIKIRKLHQESDLSKRSELSTKVMNELTQRYLILADMYYKLTTRDIKN